MRPRELVLVRHGESEGNVAAARAHDTGSEVVDVPARDADVHLSELGREQAQALGAALATWPEHERPDVVAVSPYLRARETADVVLGSAGWSVPVHVDERLRDRELGVLDRLTSAGVAARFPEEAERREWQGKFFHRPAGGESWVDVALRLRTWLADLDREGGVPGPAPSPHPGQAERVLVVAHDVVLALLRYVCEELSEDEVLALARETPLRNASLSRLLREEDGRWSCPAYDDVAHLRAAGLPVTEHRGERRDA